MNKILSGVLAVAVLAAVLSGGWGSAAAREETAAAVAKAGKADYRWLLTAGEVEAVTGFAGLRVKAIDAQKSGEAADLTFSTADGRRILMVQVLRGQDFDMYCQQFRSQDFTAWPEAFWGPKETEAPSMFWFRKGDTLMLISCDPDGTEPPCVGPDMFVKLAGIIAGRIPAQGL